MISKNGIRIVIITIILTLIGLYEVYSSSRVWALYSKGDSFYYFNKQLIFMILGYIAMYILSKVSLEKIYNLLWIKYTLLCILKS